MIPFIGIGRTSAGRLRLPLTSPGNRASHLDDIESVASSEASDGSHGGSRPRSREAATTREFCPSTLLRDTTCTHSRGYSQEEVAEASYKRKESLEPPHASPRQG